MNKKNLIDRVNAIGSDDDIEKVVNEFNLHHSESSEITSKILGEYSGIIDGTLVVLRHRWHDRCKPFLIQPDGNKIELFENGNIIATGIFLDKN